MPRIHSYRDLMDGSYKDERIKERRIEELPYSPEGIDHSELGEFNDEIDRRQMELLASSFGKNAFSKELLLLSKLQAANWEAKKPKQLDFQGKQFTVYRFQAEVNDEKFYLAIAERDGQVTGLVKTFKSSEDLHSAPAIFDFSYVPNHVLDFECRFDSQPEPIIGQDFWKVVRKEASSFMLAANQLFQNTRSTAI